MDRCLPGEPGACGHDYAEHCRSYTAVLQAYAEHGLEHLHHDDPAGELLADRALGHWRKLFARETNHET